MDLTKESNPSGIRIANEDSDSSSCWDSSQCASNEICVSGTCQERSSSEDGTRISSPGDCDLPDPNAAPCGPEGCTEATCGEDLGDNSCGQPAGTPSTCNTYADEFYKANGVLPPNYAITQVCEECQFCDTFDSLCKKFESDDQDAPCYCNSNACQNNYGPCFECSEIDGECEKTCTDCITECNQFFKCPCDPSQTSYEIWGKYSPCQETIEYGPGGTCWKSVRDRVESFCNTSFPCEDPNPCLSNCRNVKAPGRFYDCTDAWSQGLSCESRGFIENEKTGESTSFARICNYSEACAAGCNADPSSPLYRGCGECSICDQESGLCEPNPACGFGYNKGGLYTPSIKSTQTLCWSKTACNGQELEDSGCECFGGCEGSGSPWNSIYTDGIFTFRYEHNGSFPITCGGGGPVSQAKELGEYTYQRLTRVYATGDFSKPALYLAMVTYNVKLSSLVLTEYRGPVPGSGSESIRTTGVNYREKTEANASKSLASLQGDPNVKSVTIVATF